MLRILDTGTASAEENMRLDCELLEKLDPKSEAILHLYQWSKPSATYGYFIKPEVFLNMEALEKFGIDLARRPTGGGIVFHIWDLAFSFLMPSSHRAFSLNPLENYQFVNRAVLETVKRYFALTPELIKEEPPPLGADCRNFCMAKPTQYDVVYKGMKVAGAAQRRKSQGYLHQGTISLTIPDKILLEEILLCKEVLNAMDLFSFTPLQKLECKARSDLQKILADKLEESLKSAHESKKTHRNHSNA